MWMMPVLSWVCMLDSIPFAGSRPTRLRINGNIEPISVPHVTIPSRAKKIVKPMRIAPLQYIIAEEITDPAEQAALDQMRKRLKGKKRRKKAERNGNGTGARSNSAAKKRG